MSTRLNRLWNPESDAAPPSDVSGQSERGAARKINEDAFLTGEAGGAVLILAVADGIGGSAGGDRASALAVRSLRATMRENPPLPRSDAGTTLRKACTRAQAELRREAALDPARSDMGTTLTAALVAWPILTIAHAGDSRCYRFRDSRLQCLTRDHTWGRVLLERGVLDPKELLKSRWRHVLVNFVGAGRAEADPDIGRYELRANDAVLLCTDGLTEALPEETIAAALREEPSAGATCRRLMLAVRRAGGRDDATVVVARFPGRRNPRPLPP